MDNEELKPNEGVLVANKTAVGDIGNYYGGLWISHDDNNFYWSIENYSGYHWQRIPKTLYAKLKSFKG